MIPWPIRDDHQGFVLGEDAVHLDIDGDRATSLDAQDVDSLIAWLQGARAQLTRSVR